MRERERERRGRKEGREGERGRRVEGGRGEEVKERRSKGWRVERRNMQGLLGS